MDWFTSIDNYCERTDASFLSEPLNLITNLSFILAALWAYQVCRRQKTPLDTWILVILAFSIGVGSGLFHSVAQKWAEWADVIPIGLFVFLYLGVFMRRTLGFNGMEIGLGYSGFLFLSYLLASSFDPQTLNGSNMYLGPFAALVLMTLYMKAKLSPQWKLFAWASLCFAVSLSFRTLDQALCPLIPVGTHFLWHTLNGLLIYLLLRTRIQPI